MKKKLDLVKSAFFLICLVTLCACKEKDTAYFLTHPEDIQSTYDKCHDDKVTVNQSQECAAVQEVIPLFRSYLMQLMNNPARYGLDIMHAEIKLVELQKKYHAAYREGDKKLLEYLKQQVAEQKLQIQSRLAVARLVFNMNK